MALTPEDVVNKRFQPTKFREGYDQDEVDDFLDEVVVELRRLNQENEELRQRLIASDSRISELQRSGGTSSHAQDTAEEALPEPVAAAPVPAVVAEPVAAAPVPAAPVPATPAASVSDDDDATATTNLLQLARRLHEEHVREGIEKRDSLIADAHATAARLLAEAEAQQRTQLNTLKEERSLIEGRIDDLRNFEREYRLKLKSYIEGQLHELDASQGALASSDSGFAGN
ncbi:MAG: DivIVA protein [Glaciihabitans sp.]|nr:DivIVA protein [Glaciihabitans sp.]